MFLEVKEDCSALCSILEKKEKPCCLWFFEHRFFGEHSYTRSKQQNWAGLCVLLVMGHFYESDGLAIRAGL